MRVRREKGHVTVMEKEVHRHLWWENLKQRELLEDTHVHNRIILKGVLNRSRGCGLDSYGLGQGPVTVPCEHTNEPSGSIKSTELFSVMRTF